MRLTWIKSQAKTKAQQSLQGQQAQALLSNEAFTAAMQDIETHYTDMWKDSSPFDKEARETLYLAMQVIKKLKSQLAGYHQDYIINQQNGKLDAERTKMKHNLNKVL